MPPVSLKTVGQKALAERDFFEALVKHAADPDVALRQYGMSLQPQDLKVLKDALQAQPAPGRFTFTEFIRRLHTTPFPNPFQNWDPDWLIAWLPIHKDGDPGP